MFTFSDAVIKYQDQKQFEGGGGDRFILDYGYGGMEFIMVGKAWRQELVDLTFFHAQEAGGRE